MDQVAMFSEPHPLTDVEEKSLEDLQILMASYPKIRFQTDQYFLTKYLRASDWCPQKAFDHMRRIYKLRRDHSDCFATKPLSEYMDLFKHQARLVLDKTDVDGRQIFVAKFGKFLPPCLFTDSNILDDIWLHMLLSQPNIQINGLTIIGDCQGVDSSVLKWFTVKNIKLCVAKMGSMPLKKWTVHIVNMGPVINTCTSLIMPFLKKELKERIFFHDKNLEKLHEKLGKDCLPEEYGGFGGAIDYEPSLECLLKSEKWFDKCISQNYGYIDES